MTLKARIDDDLKAALLERRRFDTDVLRGLKAAILNEEVATGRRDEGLAEADVERIIAREVKKRSESAALYETGGRDDLAEVEKQEAALLAQYLPTQLSDDELNAAVDATIAKLGATDAKAMGQVIGALKGELGTRVDGGRLAAVVKQKLAQ